jgi:hypothetical protein
MMSLRTEAPESPLGGYERVYGIPERPFRLREKFVMHVDTDAMGPVRCHGARFRIESIMLPSLIGYRFRIGLVIDGREDHIAIAKTYPFHGALLSEMSTVPKMGLLVKRRFEIHVRRYAIVPTYRFRGEKYDADKHLLVHAERPTLKEPETVVFVGMVRLLMAPPNGWN